MLNKFLLGKFNTKIGYVKFDGYVFSIRYLYFPLSESVMQILCIKKIRFKCENENTTKNEDNYLANTQGTRSLFFALLFLFFYW